MFVPASIVRLLIFLYKTTSKLKLVGNKVIESGERMASQALHDLFHDTVVKLTDFHITAVRLFHQIQSCQ